MRQITIGTAALAAAALLAACSSDPSAPADAAGAGENPTARATQPDYQTIPEDSGLIEPGRWAVQAAGPVEAPLAVFDIPDGFNGGGPFIWTNKAVIGYWSPDGVYADPCTDDGRPPSAGESVEELADALAAQEVTTTTDPAPVWVGGHDGLYLELSTPPDFDFASCRAKGLRIWRDRPLMTEPTVDRYWILDVDGQRVMIMVAGDSSLSDSPDTSETRRLFTGIVEGATFVDPA